MDDNDKQDILKLQRTVRFFEALLRASADGIVITDSAKNIIFVNDTFCGYFSRKYQEVIETNIFVWLETKNRYAQDIWEGMENKIKEHGIARDVEFRMKIKEDIRYFSVDASLLEKVDIEEAGLIISIWRDDTQRKVAENNLKSAHDELEMRVKERTIQLQESEGKYRRLFEYSNDIIVYVNMFGKVLAVNNKVEEILGFKPQEVIGKHFIHLGILGVGDLPRIYELFKKTVRKGMTRDDTGRLLDRVEMELRTRSGNSILTETSTTVVKKDGKTEGFLTTIRDITERSRMEKDLKISEEKFRTLFKTMAQGVVYHDAQGKIISANPAAESILGLTFDQMQGRSSMDPQWRSIHEDGSGFPGETHPSMEALRTGKEVKNVIMGVFNPLKDEYRWIKINAVPQFKKGEEKPFQVYATFDDITLLKIAEDKHKSAEKELKASLVRIDAILSAVPDIIMEIDENNVYTWANKPGFGFFGDDVVGKETSYYFEGEQETYDVVQMLSSGNEEVTYVESWQRRIDGKKRLLAWWCRLLKDTDGKVTGVLSTARDITESKLAQEELIQRTSISVLGSEIGISLTRIGENLQGILQQCSKAIVRNLDVAFARIWILNGNMLELQASAGIYTHIDGPHSRIPVGSFKVGVIAQERKPYLTNEVIGDPHISDQEWARKEGIVSFAGYPLIVEDRLVGVMAMFGRKPLNEVFLKSLDSIADNIALGIQRKRTEEFAARRNNQLHILSSAAQKINTVLDIPVIMQNLVNSAIEITDSTAGTAGIIINEKIVFSEYIENGKISPINYVFEKGYGVPGQVMKTKLPYISNDAQHDPHVIQEIRNTLGFTNLANVPILDKKGDILGSFQIHNTREHRPFDQLDIEMLQGLASSAAIAIENTRMMDEMRRSEEDKKNLSSILDKSLNEIYMFDVQTLRFTYVNSGACKNLNYSPEALRSMTALDLKPEFDKESFHKLTEPLLQHKKNKIIFYSNYRRSDGSQYPVEVHLQLIEKPSRVFLAIVIDITERSRMEKDLKLSEEKYRTLYETMAQGVVYHDADGKIISVNPAAQNILGLSINHLIGRTSIDPAWKAIHEDGTSFPEQMHPSMMALRTRKKVSHVIMGVFNPVEKKYRWIMVNAVPQIRYAQTKPYQVYSTFDDITNIKQAEEEIQAANMELMTMNRLITATTGILDINRILETVLDESIKIVGFEGGSICLLNHDETLQLTVHRGLSEAAVSDLTNNKVKTGECLCGESVRVMKPLILPDPEAVKKSNTREASFDKNLRYHAAFPIVTSGKCVGVLCVFTHTDKKLSGKSLKFLETITAQVALSIDNARLYQEGKDYVEKLEKKVQERTLALQENQMSLLNLVDDMNRTTSELESANKRLLELDRMKSMFIASTSHELRTPLNSIIGFTSILLEGWSGELTPEQREQIQIVNTSGKHLLSLINDVIDISKAEAGKLEVHVSRFNLKEVIDEVVTTLKPELNGKGLLLHVEADDLELNTDRKRLLQCLINLLSNAVKFTEKGEIKVRAKSINNEIEISIEDTGIGMKKEDIPKIFNAFVRLDSPLTNKTSGTGLGLYLTQKLTNEVLFGTIKVKSEYGRGSNFFLRIPKEVKI